MPITRKWTASAQAAFGGSISVTFECPYYNELVANETPNGRLPKTEFAAHALWEYYGAALQSYNRAKANLVEESELSLKFDQETARRLFEGIANKHNVKPWQMVRFWPLIEAQRIALGGKDYLPEFAMFKYWRN